MTTEEIVKLAQDKGISFAVCFDKHDYSYNGIEGSEEDFLKFAQAIYEEGYEQHRKDILGEKLYGVLK